MARTSQTLTNTDLAFLLCALAASPQSPKIRLSFETDYGLALSLEPDGSITIRLRKHEPPAPCPMSKKEYTNLLDPFDSATPIQSQQQLFSSSSNFHGSIDGVLFSGPSRAFKFDMTTGGTGATITPARSTPPSRLSPMSTPTMTRHGTSDQKSPLQEMANRAGVSSASSLKIKYCIRPGLEVNSSSHMYYTASASASVSTKPQSHHQSHARHEPGATSNNTNLKFRPRTLHRVKLSHLQSLYHTHLPSRTGAGTSSSRKSSSSSWFDAYLDWIDRLDDALSRHHGQPQPPQPPPQTATPPLSHPITRAPRHKMTGSEPQGQTSGTMNHGGPFTDSGERCLWLVEGMLLATWLLLQEGVEGVEYWPLPHMSAETGTESGMEVYVYRLESNLQGMDNGNNAGVMMKRLLEVVGAEE